MARIVSCGKPRSCVQMVREYCVRLLRGSKANAPDANQAATAANVAMRFPTGPSIKPGDRRNVFQFLGKTRGQTERFPVSGDWRSCEPGKRSVCPRVFGV